MCIPLANDGVGLGPSSSGPVTSRPPLADRSASAASSTPGDSPGFPRATGFSLTVAAQAGFALFWVHLPSPVGYMVWVSCEGPFHLQALYGVECGFLLWLHRSEGFCLSSFRGYRLMSAVFHFRLPVISFHPVLRALFRSFRVSSPSRAVCPPSWALAVFLRHLPSLSFASLCSTPLHLLVKTVLFFVALATAIPLGELQALSRCFSFV